VVIYSFFILLSLNIAFGCKDLHPQLCKEYKANPRVDTCTYQKIGVWMQNNCFKTCNLCHLYTTKKPITPKPRTIPPMVNCGRSMVPKGRVIAGQTAIHGAWPWQVQLRYRNNFLCGGTLVSPYYIVTAAHCLSGRRKAAYFTVALGDHNRNITEASETVYKVRNFYIHGGYSRPNIGMNDIAIIKLEKPVKMTDKIQRICLPDVNEELSDGTECYITGWGKTKHPAYDGARVLQQASLKTVGYETCKKWNENMKRVVSKSMLCAGDLVSPKSGCHGDSGGPFVCKKPDGRWFLHGVVSWGSPICNSKHGYSVFTKVSHYRSWLDYYVWY